MPLPTTGLLFALLAPALAAHPQEPAPVAPERSDMQLDHAWPQWRGPLGTGVAPHADPPLEWSETKNLRWRIVVPGTGHASPVVVGDRIFLLTAIPYGEEVEPVPDDMPGAHDNAPVTRRHHFAVVAVRRADGAILWMETVYSGLPARGAHVSASLASSSPVTDGEQVWAFFGSQGLYCLDREGGIVWQRDLGDLAIKHGHGEGSTPVLFGERLFVNWDHEGESFVTALDKRSGDELWRTPREELTSWSSPIVAELESGPQLVVPGTNRVRGYDVATGKVIWECSGLSQNIVASPVAGEGLVFVGSSYEKRALLAIRLMGATGDITGTDQVAWQTRRGTPYVPSPLLYGKWLYYFSHYQNVLSRVEAATGAQPDGPFRLDGFSNAYASPVAARDRVYLTDLDGRTLVLAHGEGPLRVLASNQLGDSFSASPALVDRELYLRGSKYLYCIAEER